MAGEQHTLSRSSAGDSLEMGVVNPAFSPTHDDDLHQANGKPGPGPEPEHQDAMVHGREPEQEPEPEPEQDLRCGWWLLRPSCLQRFRSAKWALFWLCWTGGVQGMVVNGLVNVVITTIERRFGLRSSQSGLVAGAYDIASFLCLVPVTYLGGRAGASKPRWLGWGVVVMGFGSLLFGLPHFLAGPYRGAVHKLDTCRPHNSTTPPFGDDTDCYLLGEDRSGASSPVYLWLFVLGQLLHGAGAAPLYTLGVTFIDENVSKKMSSVYLGIFYTMAVVGPALGYVIGGQLLQIYTDFMTVDPSELGLTPLSNVWVGAWWVGFLLSAVLCFLLAIPLLAFPVEMPGAAQLRAEKECEAHDASDSGPSTAQAFSKLREMPRAFRALISNPTFFFLNMAGASEGLLLSGFAAFLPKLIENQFSVAASRAALLMGLVTVPAGGGGTFLGGYLVKRFALRCASIIKLCVVATALGVALIFCFFTSCPNIAFAGVTRSYGDVENATNLLESALAPALDSACNSACRCFGVAYDPVCGADNVLYYSPCHAGCTTEVTLDSAKVYTNCSCVNAYHSRTADTPVDRRRRRRHIAPGEDPEEDNEEDAFSPKNIQPTVEYDAINEPCSSNCNLLWAFIVMAFFTMLFTFLVTMPALTATLRCVQEEQRSFALGIQWIKVRLLGTIPAPMIFGILMDETCVLWQNDDCTGEQGSCVTYHNLYMSRYMLSIAFIGRACSLVFFSLAWCLYKPPQVLHAKSQEKLDEQEDDGQTSPVGTLTHTANMQRIK